MPHRNAQRSLTERTPGYLPGEERRIHLVRKLGPVAPEALTQTRGGVPANNAGPRLFAKDALPPRRAEHSGRFAARKPLVTFSKVSWKSAKAYARSIGFSFAWHLPRF